MRHTGKSKSLPQCWAGRAASLPPRGCRDDPETMLRPTVAVASFPPSPSPQHPSKPCQRVQLLEKHLGTKSGFIQDPRTPSYKQKVKRKRNQITGSLHSHPARARRIRLGRKTSPYRWVDLDVECPQSNRCLRHCSSCGKSWKWNILHLHYIINLNDRTPNKRDNPWPAIRMHPLKYSKLQNSSERMVACCLQRGKVQCTIPPRWLWDVHWDLTSWIAPRPVTEIQGDPQLTSLTTKDADGRQLSGEVSTCKNPVTEWFLAFKVDLFLSVLSKLHLLQS